MPRRSHKVPRPLAERTPSFGCLREILASVVAILSKCCSFRCQNSSAESFPDSHSFARSLRYKYSSLFLFHTPRPDLQGPACSRMQSPPHNLRAPSHPQTISSRHPWHSSTTRPSRRTAGLRLRPSATNCTWTCLRTGIAPSCAPRQSHYRYPVIIAPPLVSCRREKT